MSVYSARFALKHGRGKEFSDEVKELQRGPLPENDQDIHAPTYAQFETFPPTSSSTSSPTTASPSILPRQVEEGGQPLTAPPYSVQTGPTKTAPMQERPGTTITAKGEGRLYPTSSYEVARSRMAPADVVTTVTVARKWAVLSVVNEAGEVERERDAKGRFI